MDRGEYIPIEVLCSSVILTELRAILRCIDSSDNNHAGFVVVHLEREKSITHAVMRTFAGLHIPNAALLVVGPTNLGT